MENIETNAGYTIKERFVVGDLGIAVGFSKCSSRMDEKLVRKITSVLLVLSGISLILKNL